MKVPRKKAFTKNGQNKIQKIGVQVTFILEIKLEKYIFYEDASIFSGALASILNLC